MKYKLAVHPAVIDTLVTLPFQVRFETVKVFQKILHLGVTSYWPGQVHWGMGNSFSLSIYEHVNDPGLQNGAFAKGFVHDPFDQTFYIRHLHHIADEKCLQSKMQYTDLQRQNLTDKNTDDYIVLGEGWISDILGDTFVQNALKVKPSLPLLPSTLATKIQNNFYPSLDQIYTAKRKEWAFKSTCAYNDEWASASCKREVFDVTKKNKSCRNELREYIESLITSPEAQVPIFVNFIDEQDPLSLAQKEYINLVTALASLNYKMSPMHIVDVIIRDIQGATPYYEDFLYYSRQGDNGDTSNEPNPFTLVLGIPPIRNIYPESEPVHFPCAGRQRLLNIDLFAGCRGVLPNNPAYQRNVKNSTHQILACIGLFTEIFSHPAWDSTQFSIRQLLRVEGELLKNAIVVKVYADEQSKTMEIARMAVANAVLSGYPNVIIMKADDVFCQGHSIKVYICGEEREFYGYTDEEIQDEHAVGNILYDIRRAYEENPALSSYLKTEKQQSLIPSLESARRIW